MSYSIFKDNEIHTIEDTTYKVSTYEKIGLNTYRFILDGKYNILFHNGNNFVIYDTTRDQLIELNKTSNQPAIFADYEKIPH